MATEKRLIDSNALLKVLKHRVKGNEDNGIVIGTNSTLEIMEEMVQSIPTVDAVEVVRCKDCKNYVWDEFDGCYVCVRTARYTKKEFWCAYGERENNG